MMDHLKDTPLSSEDLALRCVDTYASAGDLSAGDQVDQLYLGRSIADGKPDIEINRLFDDGEYVLWTLRSKTKGNAFPRVRQTILGLAEHHTADATLIHPAQMGKMKLTHFPHTSKQNRPRVLRRFDGRKVEATQQGQFTQIFGADDRKILLDTGYPWCCTGRIHWVDTRGQMNIGSGALVGPNIVLTANHVLPWDQSALIWFVPMLFGANSLLPGQPRAFVIDQASWDSSAQDVCGYDFAVCRLSSAMGTADRFGHFGVRVYKDQWEDGNYWHHTGYPYDIFNSEFPVVQRDIAVADDDSDQYGSLEIETYSDTASGMSGGPLFGFWDDGPYVLGVASGRETEPEFNFHSFEDTHTVFAGGSPLVRLVKWARQNWAV